MSKISKKKLDILFLLGILLLFIFQLGCKKMDTYNKIIQAPNSLSIEEAKEYFNHHFIKQDFILKRMASDFERRKSNQNQNELTEPDAMWDGAIIRNLSIGTNAVLTPLYIKDVYVNISSTRMVKYGFLNYLMMYKNKENEIVTEWIELKPTEEWIDSKVAMPYEGRVLVKSRDGKIRKVFSYGIVEPLFKNSQRITTRSALSNDIMRNSGGEEICFITTTYTRTVSPKLCPCESHTYSQIDICECSEKPQQGYNIEFKVEEEIDCFEFPDEPIGGGGSGNNGGSDHGEGGGGGGGGTPGSGDYLPCNPDPDYVMPTIPPPPGTEYILPCSGIDIPVEDNPGGDPEGNEEEEDEDDFFEGKELAPDDFYVDHYWEDAGYDNNTYINPIVSNPIYDQEGYRKNGTVYNYNGGSVQNYTNDNGGKYAVFKKLSGVEIKFPGATITDFGVLAGKGVTTSNGGIHADLNFSLKYLQHEYGHYLQAKLFGSYLYNTSIVPASLWSMTFFPSTHNSFWTETHANNLAIMFFGNNSDIALDPTTFPR